MTIPAAPQESGDNKRLLFLCESDGAGGLRPVLFCTAANDGQLTEGERLQALAVGGRRARGEAATDGPVPVGGTYYSSPSNVDDGDMVTVLTDAAGRVQIAGPDTVETYNVTLTNANTEYSQTLPSNVRAVAFRCRTACDVRFAWESGRVAAPIAPYQTLKANGEYWKDNIRVSSLTLYLASDTAGVVVEVEAWS